MKKAHNFLIVFLTILIAKIWCLNTMHDDAINSCHGNVVIFWVLIIILIFYFRKLKVKSGNAFLFVFGSLFVTILFHLFINNPIFFKPNFYGVSNKYSYALEKNKKVYHPLYEGNFEINYLYKASEIDLFEKASGSKNIVFEVEKYVFWQTGFVNGFSPITIDSYSEPVNFKDEVILFFNIFLFVIIECSLGITLTAFLFVFIVSLIHKHYKGKYVWE